MISLLRSEWYQIRKTLAVKIFFLFILITSVILGMREAGASYASEIKEAGWDYLLYGGGSLLSSMEDYSLAILIAALLSGWIVSSGFETRTIQEAVCYGKSRTKVYMAKMFIFCIVVFWKFVCICKIWYRNTRDCWQLVPLELYSWNGNFRNTCIS